MRWVAKLLKQGEIIRGCRRVLICRYDLYSVMVRTSERKRQFCCMYRLCGEPTALLLKSVFCGSLCGS
jgi:hypothetical protein